LLSDSGRWSRDGGTDPDAEQSRDPSHNGSPKVHAPQYTALGVVEAGGQIVVEEMEVPNVGSFSLFADPDGRVLGMWKQADQHGQKAET